MKWLPSILLAVWLFPAFAQQQDFRLWTSLSQEVNLGKNVELQLGQQARFNNNVVQLERHFYDVGLNFKLGDVYRLSPGYRFTDGLEEIGHRIQIDQSLNHNLPNKWWLKQRLRLQWNLDQPIYVTDYRIRYQFKLVKKFRKDFYLYTEPELFYRHRFNFQDFYQYRLEGGMKLEMGKGDWAALDLFYIFEEEFNIEAPLRSHILGFGLSFNLN